jgi:hypothetical protein
MEPLEKALNKLKVIFLKGLKMKSNFLLNFYFINGVLGTHRRGCAEFAPFWEKIKI